MCRREPSRAPVRFQFAIITFPANASHVRTSHSGTANRGISFIVAGDHRCAHRIQRRADRVVMRLPDPGSHPCAIGGEGNTGTAVLGLADCAPLGAVRTSGTTSCGARPSGESRRCDRCPPRRMRTQGSHREAEISSHGRCDGASFHAQMTAPSSELFPGFSGQGSNSTDRFGLSALVHDIAKSVAIPVIDERSAGVL